MSENQQPLDEEQAVSDVQEQETLPAAACPLRRTKMHPPSSTRNQKRKKKILILLM